MDEINALDQASLQSSDASLNDNVEIQDQASLGSAENAAEQDASLPSSDSSQLEDGKSETQRNLAAEQGKMSSLERERNELQKRLEEAENGDRAFKRVSQLLEKNKDAYESIRKAYLSETGTDMGPYEQHYKADGSLKQDSSGTTQSTASAPVDQAQLQKLIDNQVQTTLKQHEDQNRVIKSFWSDIPEMDPNKMDPEQITKAAEVFERTIQVARGLAQAYPNMTPEEALKNAYYSLPENREKALSQAQETGKYMGQAVANGQKSGQEGASGGSTTSPMNPSALFNRAPKDVQSRYKELYDKDPSFANRFLQKAVSGE
jgi:hypothetical protein